VLDAGAEQEQLIEALLMLARSQRGLDNQQIFDLGQVAADVLEGFEQRAAGQGVAIERAIDSARVSGDPHLVARLVSNLVENAVRYNTPGGDIVVLVDGGDQHATLRIANTGPKVPGDQIKRLLEPFQRLAPDREAATDGHGLGLSTVTSIADAHHATLNIQPRAGGGLDITVSFPTPSGQHPLRPLAQGLERAGGRPAPRPGTEAHAARSRV
jgi:signal transduction histidine kinase